eukprot:jgi/Tetstr1/444661/TSEL_032509.t1
MGLLPAAGAEEIPLALMEVLAAGAGWEEEGLGEEGEGKVAEETEVEGWGAREEEGLEAREEEGLEAREEEG